MTNLVQNKKPPNGVLRANVDQSHVALPKYLSTRITSGSEKFAGKTSSYSYGDMPVFSSDYSVQTKLSVNAPGDKFEQEADAVADTIMKMPDTTSRNLKSIGCDGDEKNQLQLKPLSAGISSLMQNKSEETKVVNPALSNKITSSQGNGQKMDSTTQTFMSGRFGADFSNVKIHADDEAASINRDLNAKACTVGNNIFFNRGFYNPTSAGGKHLLAHELVHTIQQGGNSSTSIQLTSLTNYKDPAKPDYDPSRLTDAQIEATNEYKTYMDSNLVWQWKDKITREEALLACRLILRSLREGNNVTWSSDARAFMNMARKEIGVVAKTQAMVGQDEWVQFSTTQAVADPSKLQSEFAKWLLAGGPEPKGAVDKMNCWEAVLSGSFRGGFITKVRLVDIYTKAVDNVKAGITTYVGDTVEIELRASKEHILDLSKPTTTEQPLRGDIIIFSKAKDHVAISLGTIDSAGEHEILSLWNYDGRRPHLEKTTIEKLVRGGAPTPIKFWTAKW